MVSVLFWGKNLIPFEMWIKTKKFFFNVLFIFERERVRAGEGKRERGQRMHSQLHAHSSDPNAGLELTNHEIMTWAEVRHSADEAPQVPRESKNFKLWGNWGAPSVERATLDFGSGHGPRDVGLSPTSGSVLSVEPAWDSLSLYPSPRSHVRSLSLSLSLALALALSLSLK